MLLYDTLTRYYHLLDPPEDHAAEAACYRDALARHAPPDATLLDLGAGAGHNALYLESRFRCTLADLSEAMLARSRARNPASEHVVGDMRVLRLGRVFDAVLVHDAIMYMTSEVDLRAAIETAFVHTRPGGAAVIAPDVYKDGFREETTPLDGDDGVRALRGVAWSWDPDPNDDTFVTEYGLLLRHGADVHAVHDRHVEGLFTRATWRRLLEAAGFRVETIARPLDDGDGGATDEIFLCRRP